MRRIKNASASVIAPDPVTPTPKICEGCWFLLANGKIFPGCKHCSTLMMYRPDLASLTDERSKP
jgi:hypothetical protein